MLIEIMVVLNIAEKIDGVMLSVLRSKKAKLKNIEDVNNTNSKWMIIDIPHAALRPNSPAKLKKPRPI